MNCHDVVTLHFQCDIFLHIYWNKLFYVVFLWIPNLFIVWVGRMGFVSSASTPHNITALCEPTLLTNSARLEFIDIFSLCEQFLRHDGPYFNANGFSDPLYGDNLRSRQWHRIQRPFCSVQRHQWTELGVGRVFWSLELLHSQEWSMRRPMARSHL